MFTKSKSIHAVSKMRLMGQFLVSATKNTLSILNQKSKFALLALFVMPTTAFAGVDWLSQISDTGYDPVAAGADIVYQVRVANNGTSAAPATTIVLNIPAATTYQGATGAGFTCPAGPTAGPATVTCGVSALSAAGNAGDLITANVTIRTSVQGNVNFSASVPTAGDDDTLNNTPAEGTTVNAGADMALTLTGPATAQSGGTVSYLYTVTNNGPNNNTTGTTLTITIPTGLVVTNVPGCTQVTGTTYSCSTFPLAVGASDTRTLTGQISVASGSTITPSGSISGGSPSDPVSGNNTATTNTTVTAGSDLRIAKARSPATNPLLEGDTIDFVLSPTYTGGSPTSITVTDTIPSNYTIGTVLSPQNGWTCNVTGQTVTCTKPAGTVPGNNVPLGTITIPVTATTAGNGVVNTATIAGPVGQDPNPANNTATDGGVNITQATVDLRANKFGPIPALVVVGNTYSYIISTTNVGTAGFFGTIEMADSLPAGLRVDSYNPTNGWSCLPAAPVTGPATITCSRVYTAGAPLAANATTPEVTFNTVVVGCRCRHN